MELRGSEAVQQMLSGYRMAFPDLRHEKIISWHVYHDTVPFLTALGIFPAR